MESVYIDSAELKIGVIGPRDSFVKIKKAVGDYYQGIELIPYIREYVNESIDAFEAAERCCDGMIFTGVGVEGYIREHREIHTPYVTIPRGGYSIMSTIWAMSNDRVNYERLSIDVVDDQILQEVIDEFDIQFTALYTMPYQVVLEESEYADHHRDLFRDRKIDAIITGFGSVYTALKEEGLPVYRLYPNTILVRQNLETLIHHIKSTEMRSAGIAIQIVRLKGMTHDSLCKYDDLKKRGEFYLRIVDYVREVQGSLFAFGREEMIIFTTRGELESQMNRAMFRGLVAWGRQHNTNFYSGIGYGSTAYEAERAARKALEHAKRLTASGAFIVDNGEIIGPIDEMDELKYQLKVDDKRILTISERTGIDASYITKLQAIIEKNGKKEYDSLDLADILGVGERTARRLIKKILDAGYGVVAAKESASRRGRPRTIVRIEF